MRQNVENARDRGVSLAFFSANVCYWQVRFEPSSSNGQPDRTMVCYKTGALDPFATDGNPSNDCYITTLWRLNSVKPPEDALVGIFYRYLVNTNMVIDDASHWICAGAGLTNGSIFPNLVGGEGDTLGTHTPMGTALIAHSPCLENGLPPGFADMTVYTALSGADVFAAGTEQWGWGLDGQYSQRGAQQMTRNILPRLARCAPIQRGMLSWWAAEGNAADDLGRNPGLS